MKKTICAILCLTLIFGSVVLCACGDGSFGLQYSYRSLQTGPLSGNFSGEYTVTGYTGSASMVIVPYSYRGHSVYHIAEGAFANNTKIQSVVLTTALITIKAGAFKGCTGITKVYYDDNQEVCKRLLTIQYDNECLENATWYYYSEEQPKTQGHFWHWQNKKVVEW